jgi:hypothetical protein
MCGAEISPTPVEMLISLYTSGADKLLAKGKEAFQQQQQAAAAAATSASTAQNVFFILYLVFAVLAGFGAAYLSWTYNKYRGTNTLITVIYAILAFLFSEFYYPLYAFFLNPIRGFENVIKTTHVMPGNVIHTTFYKPGKNNKINTINRTNTPV